MNPIRYLCHHCGRRFEAEEKDIVECPGCFWSTSVKRDDGSSEAGLPGMTLPQKERKSPALSLPLKPVLGFLLFAIAAGAAVYFFPMAVDFFKSMKDGIASSTRGASPRLPAGQAGNDVIAGSEGAKQSRMSPWETLSPEDVSILHRRLQFDPERSPAEEEKSILEYRVPFKTGFVEQLPSQIWTLEELQSLIEKQEIFYKITLAKSYKLKLTEHFEQTYLSAGTAFEAGDLTVARDGWIASLMFPIYSNDIGKHRGVVLTMLRPLINDTLSKIGALNHTLLEKQIREQEHGVNQKYVRLIETAKTRSWQDAVRLIGETRAMIAELENPQTALKQPPPYPPVLGQVDDGIRVTLIDLLSTPAPAVADFEPIRNDLDKKEKVILSFFPDSLAEQQRLHDEALDHIRNQQARPAIERLRSISYPVGLVEDAKEKMRILQQIDQAKT